MTIRCDDLLDEINWKHLNGTEIIQQHDVYLSDEHIYVKYSFDTHTSSRGRNEKPAPREEPHKE